MSRKLLHHDKKDPPGTGSIEAGRSPVGFSADILVGARHDLHMQAGLRLHECLPVQRSVAASSTNIRFSAPRAPPLP